MSKNDQPNHKMIIVSAPSGAGKTTIVKHLLKTFPQLGFSVSATSRKMREGEMDGREYYFMSSEEFRLMIAQEKLRNLEFLGRFDIITVGEDESYAANCLPVNGTVIVPAGFPRTASEIVSAGLEIIELEMSEFMKMDGGLTCLSLRF